MKTLICFLLCLPLFVFGQAKPPDAQDLRIGLVLSGGGAKCMAQIGALKVIEEAGIQVDYIGGTSMGAIIGAMYSLGYSVEEIEVYMRKVDWTALMENEVPRNRLSYFDRKLDERYFLNLPIQDRKIRLPKGLNYAQYIIKELSNITQQSFRYEDFSEFPIPFFCVAANLQSGKARTFEDGRLLDALRASSAFPSLFTPYEVEDSLYIDGGILNNYPADIMEQKGVDVIIGIDVQDFLYSKEDLNSVIRVLEQSSSFINARQMVKRRGATDILITPETPKVGLTNFDKYEELLKAGETAARKELSSLQTLAKRDLSKPFYDRSHGKPLESILVSAVEIQGHKASTEQFILGKLRVRPGDSISINKLERGVDQLYGTYFYETVDYTIEPMDQGFKLVVRVRENDVLSNLRLGLNYNDDFETALLLNYTQRNLLFRNSRLSIDLAIGDNPRSELNYFVDRGFIPTIGFKLRTFRFSFRNYDNLIASNQGVYQDYSLDVFLQSTLLDAYAFGGGVQIENAYVEQDFALPGIEEFNKSFINYYGFLDFDSFDDEAFPTQGFQLSGKYRIISEREGFESFYEPSSVIDLSYAQAISFSPRWTLVTKLFGVGTIGPSLSFPYRIHLGSAGRQYPNYIYPFLGYRFLELSGRNMAALRGDLSYQFYEKHYLSFSANVGKLEAQFSDLFVNDILLDGYGLGYSYDSPIGPLSIKVIGSTNHDNIYSYLSLGYWF